MLGWLSGIVLVAVLLGTCGEEPRGIATPVNATPLPAAGAARIEGVLRDRGQPVAGATVTLTAYTDQACAGLADAIGLTEAGRARLAVCRRTAGTATTDALGRFAFDDLVSGWYRVAVRWELRLNQMTGLGAATTQRTGVWTIRYGHARTIDGGWLDFAVAETSVQHLTAGDVLTLDLAHVPPR